VFLVVVGCAGSICGGRRIEAVPRTAQAYAVLRGHAASSSKHQVVSPTSNDMPSPSALVIVMDLGVRSRSFAVTYHFTNTLGLISTSLTGP
jgi:hypothetical protein